MLICYLGTSRPALSVVYFIVSLAFPLTECGEERGYGNRVQGRSPQCRSVARKPSVLRQRWGQQGVVFACMPSCIVILINGDRSRSLQTAKLTLTAEDWDRGGTSTIPKDREGGQMGLKRGEGRRGGNEGGGG